MGLETWNQDRCRGLYVNEEENSGEAGLASQLALPISNGKKVLLLGYMRRLVPAYQSMLESGRQGEMGQIQQHRRLEKGKMEADMS